ncbi:MAG: Na(+)-translocating NADH-quinone reductase subunit C [Phycisphaerales bacterium]|nr:Na(+)-translocating NADH-quinone reductase subunit C [Phycisphaerales bacterium]
MQRSYSVPYIIGFSCVVCVVCSLLVSSAAVSLKPRQEQNAQLDRQVNVLMAAGLVESGQRYGREQITQIFMERIDPVVIDLATGEETDIDPLTFDPDAEMKDPTRSNPAPSNPAQVKRIPNHALVFKVNKDGDLNQVVLPILGKGLWSTMYGYIAVDADGRTVRGLTFYQHGETPGLGGEVDNPRWKDLWPGRRIYDPAGNVRIEVVKGRAGPPEEAPYEVDGLSGATITSRGVSHTLEFWFGEHGFGPYLVKLRESRRAAS